VPADNNGMLQFALRDDLKLTGTKFGCGAGAVWLLHRWLRVGQDGEITLSTGKVEYGQGIQTGFAQLVADELDVRFDSVQVVMGSTRRRTASP
jgi:CO/xanthine dehydrogenase Mo-binding subunit